MKAIKEKINMDLKECIGEIEKGNYGKDWIFVPNLSMK